MTDRLIHRTINNEVSLEISESRFRITIFNNQDKIAKFDIEDVWDMIKNSLIIMDVGPNSFPGLFRRKREAIAAAMEGIKLPRSS